MNDEFTARQRAIALRLAGRPAPLICQALSRTATRFRKWWRRYLEFGATGLYDLTRARHVIQRVPPELEQAILSVRRRLQAHATPATRYSLIGASAIRAELKALRIRPPTQPAHHRARAPAQHQLVRTSHGHDQAEETRVPEPTAPKLW
jgi:hypothetical protein